MYQYICTSLPVPLSSPASSNITPAAASLLSFPEIRKELSRRAQRQTALFEVCFTMTYTFQ